MIVTIDGPMIIRFVENSDKFDMDIEERFKMIDQDHRQRVKFPKSDALDTDDGFLSTDLEGYRNELRAMMMAVAHGIGGTPINVLVDEGSLLIKAFNVEIERLKEEDETKKKMEERVETNNLQKNMEGSEKPEIVQEITEKKMRKKKSMKIFKFCACSGKYYGD